MIVFKYGFTVADTFAANSSLRGVGKFYKTSHRLLKILWLVFIFTMLVVFVNGTISLFEEYFQYKTTLQRHRVLHERTVFPSISVCSLQPFGRQANELWSNNSVLSPASFTNKLRSLLGLAAEKKNWSLAEDLFLQDDMENYYQNLKLNESKAVGQQHEDLLAYFGISDGKKELVGLANTSNLRIKEFSLARHFNCFTIDIKSANLSKNVNEFQLMFYLGNDSESTNALQDGLVGNLFMNSRGIKLKLHERNQYPDMSKGTINIGPGLSSIISYETHHFNEIDLSHRRCFEDAITDHRKFIDAKFNAKYHYSFDACISAELDRIVLQNCSCVWPMYLNSQLPNKTHPFCGELHPTEPDSSCGRLNCVLQLNFSMIVEQLAQTKCAQRCYYYKYLTRHSSAAWLPKSWQLYWMHRVSRAFRNLKNNTSNISKDAVNTIQKYISAKVITQRPKNADDQQWLNLESVQDYTLIRVQRSSFETLHTDEKMSITLSTFVSRIGGMGSVTLGMNIAIFVELLEWWYLSMVAIRKKHRETCHQKSESVSEAEEEEKLPMAVQIVTTT